MIIPMAFADHAMATTIHDGATMFILVMGLSTREVTCCTALLTVGGELSRPAMDVHRPLEQEIRPQTQNSCWFLFGLYYPSGSF